MYAVSNDQLKGSCDYSRAQVLQYVSMADNEVLPSVCTWVFPTLGIMQYNANVRTCVRARVCVCVCVSVLFYVYIMLMCVSLDFVLYLCTYVYINGNSFSFLCVF